MDEKNPESFSAVAFNRQARHEYFLLETLEAGIQLTGAEIKSIRGGRVNLKEGYVHIRAGEAFLEGVHITPYEFANRLAPPAVRSRRLLLHKREIDRWGQEVQQKRLTIVPVRLYLKKGRAKLEIALAKGKKLHDKRHAIKDRELKRALEKTQRRPT